MIILMAPNAVETDIEEVKTKLRTLGVNVYEACVGGRLIISVVGDHERLAEVPLEAMQGVERVVYRLNAFALVGRELQPETTIVKVGDVEFGGQGLVVIAGPCAVENEAQMFQAAQAVAHHGAHILRGGAFKPRTSPYSFQGLGAEGLKILKAAAGSVHMPTITEVLSPDHVELVGESCDMLQIGARNMQNFALLREVGQSHIPVLLKRGMSATLEEWLGAAEYIVAQGNNQVVLCERGIRTFSTHTRNTLDLSVVPAVKQLSHLPIVVDPSHGTGKWFFVEAMSLAALAAGADGLMIEVHPQPHQALSDGGQSLTPQNFGKLMERVRQMAVTLGRQY